jgi:hypothetical protein
MSIFEAVSRTILLHFETLFRINGTACEDWDKVASAFRSIDYGAGHRVISPPARTGLGGFHLRNTASGSGAATSRPRFDRS